MPFLFRFSINKTKAFELAGKKGKRCVLDVGEYSSQKYIKFTRYIWSSSRSRLAATWVHYLTQHQQHSQYNRWPFPFAIYTWKNQNSNYMNSILIFAPNFLFVCWENCLQFSLCIFKPKFVVFVCTPLYTLIRSKKCFCFWLLFMIRFKKKKSNEKISSKVDSLHVMTSFRRRERENRFDDEVMNLIFHSSNIKPSKSKHWRSKVLRIRWRDANVRSFHVVVIRLYNLKVKNRNFEIF